jgi:hypothetical protein
MNQPSGAKVRRFAQIFGRLCPAQELAHGRLRGKTTITETRKRVG